MYIHTTYPTVFVGNSELKFSCRHQVLEPCVRSKQPMSVQVLSVILVPCLQFSEFSQGNDICWNFLDLSSIRSKASPWFEYPGLAGHAGHLKCQVCIHQPTDKGGERYKNIHTESLQLGPEFSNFGVLAESTLLLGATCYAQALCVLFHGAHLKEALQWHWYWGSQLQKLHDAVCNEEPPCSSGTRECHWVALEGKPMEIPWNPMKSHNPRPILMRNPGIIDMWF